MWGGKWVLQGFALFFIFAAKRNQRLWWVHRVCSSKFHWILFPAQGTSSAQLGLQSGCIPQKNFQYRDLCPGITGKASPVQLSLDGAEQRQSCFPHKHPWNGISGIRVVRSTGNGNPPHQNGIKILCQLNNHIYSLIIHLVSALIAGMVWAKWSLAVQEVLPYKSSSFNYCSLSCSVRKGSLGVYTNPSNLPIIQKKIRLFYNQCV